MAAIFKNSKDITSYFKKHSTTLDNHVLVIGPSGVGKSYFVATLLKTGIKAVDSDRFGSLVDSKWTVDYDKMFSSLKEPHYIFGTSNNLGELVSQLKEQDDFYVMALSTTPDHFRTITRAKARDNAVTNPLRWSIGWLSSANETTAYLNKRLLSFNAIRKAYGLEKVRVVTLLNDPESISPESAGWHGGKVMASKEEDVEVLDLKQHVIFFKRGDSVQKEILSIKVVNLPPKLAKQTLRWDRFDSPKIDADDVDLSRLFRNNDGYTFIGKYINPDTAEMRILFSLHGIKDGYAVIKTFPYTALAVSTTKVWIGELDPVFKGWRTKVEVQPFTGEEKASEAHITDTISLFSNLR